MENEPFDETKELEGRLLETFQNKIPETVLSVIAQIHRKGKVLSTLGRTLDTDVIALSGHVLGNVTTTMLESYAKEAGAQVRAVDIEAGTLKYRMTCTQ